MQIADKRTQYSDFINVIKGIICTHSVQNLIESFELPLHILFKEKVIENIQGFKDTISKNYYNGQIRYALKSYSSKELLKIIKEQGVGVDVCSENEMELAFLMGLQSEQVVLNGNAKSNSLIYKAIIKDVLIVADSVYELDVIQRIAKEQSKNPSVLLRIKGFPAKSETDSCLSTAGVWTKFGMSIQEVYYILSQLGNYSELDICGFHMHIGSQISNIDVYCDFLGRFLTIVESFRRRGISIKYLDIGGGFPISYVSQLSWESFLSGVKLSMSRSSSVLEHMVWDCEYEGFIQSKDGLVYTENFFSPLSKYHMLEAIFKATVVFNGKPRFLRDVIYELGDPILLIEPGRSIVGDAGITLARVNGIKKTYNNDFLLVLEMGSVNYAGSVIHKLYNVWDVMFSEANETVPGFDSFICGNLCYNGDMISKFKISFPVRPSRGDIVITYDTGSTESHFFASNANLFPIPSRIIMDLDGNICISKQRQVLEEIVSL